MMYLKLAFALILAGSFYSQCLHAEQSIPPAHGSNVSKSLDELKWVLQPHGAEMALLWGDPKTGPSGFMVRYPANWKGPAKQGPDKMHMHTYGYQNVIVSGEMKHWHEGQTEDDVPLLKSGAYFYQPGGQYHNESFRSDQQTIIYAVFEGPRDTFFDGKKVYP